MKKLFPSQLESETIYMVVREHWVGLFLKIAIWIFFAAILVLFNRFALTYLPALFEGRWGQITTLFTQVYTLFLTLSLFLIFAIYYLNVQIITNIRIVDITQTGLFSHTISELHIDKIEDGDNTAIENLAYFLQQYSHQFGRQIILITHNDTLASIGDVSLRVVKPVNKAIVKLIDLG